MQAHVWAAFPSLHGGTSNPNSGRLFRAGEPCGGTPGRLRSPVWFFPTPDFWEHSDACRGNCARTSLPHPLMKILSAGRNERLRTALGPRDARPRTGPAPPPRTSELPSPKQVWLKQSRIPQEITIREEQYERQETPGDTLGPESHRLLQDMLPQGSRQKLAQASLAQAKPYSPGDYHQRRTVRKARDARRHIGSRIT